MQLFVASVFSICLWAHIQPSLSKNELNLHMCMNNSTLSVQILTSLSNDTSCRCQAGPSSEPFGREDYFHTPGIGFHKLHTIANSWNKARRICREENAHLAVINSLAEEKILLDMLKAKAGRIRDASNRDQAYLGVHDFFQEGEWLTVFGESMYSMGYAKWSTEWYGLQPDNAGGNQNCGALVNKGGMDDVNCDLKFAFFCEIPSTCDG